jgi:phosphoglycolate phosphatase
MDNDQMKHWVFDLDGTLVDSLTSHFQVLEKIFHRFDADFSSSEHLEVLKVNSKTLPKYFETKLGVAAVEPALVMFKELNTQSFKSIRAFPGIEDLLKTLQTQGMKLAVWTARDLEATNEILKHTGLSPYFSICVSGSCVDEGKPHPEGLKKIAAHFECGAESMVMVGDFDSDMLGAQAFGIKAIRVFWHPAVQIKKCEIADWQFHQVSEFRNWLSEQTLNQEK